MARKRMFDVDIINQDSFFDLPMDSKALYFLLGMEADDEGFVSPKKVLRLYGGTEDSLKVLASKGYIIPFKTGVIVITDWKRNNYIQKDRLKSTIYQEEKAQLEYDEETQKYVCLTNVKPMLNDCLTNVNIDKNRLDKNRLDKNSIYSVYGEFKNVKLKKEEYDKLEKSNLLPYIEKLSSYIASKGKKYKSHYATILNWARKDKNNVNKIVPEWMNKDLDKKEVDEGYEQFLRNIGMGDKK